MTQRVLITTAYLEPGGEVDRLLLEAGFETAFAPRSGPRLRRVITDVDAVVAGTDAFTAEVLEAATRLKVLGRCGAGYDNIDVETATRQGIAVTFTPGANRRSVAEHVLALMLNCARLIPQNVAAVAAGGWDQRSGRELAGATLGIVGLGSIGKTVARLALALGMRVVAYDPFLDTDFVADTGIEVRSLDGVLAEADFVSLHLFLDDSTRRLIDARALALMKPGAYLINTARGEVVDEAALADALESGHLGGAGLDVVETEPLPPDSRLRGLGNALVTAHIGAATVEARSRSSLMATRQVIDLLQGRTPDNLVNPDYAKAVR
ncbi:phosphoglycerate dehydrogenase [Amycolatopsis sp. 195334CR]|uniref:phosphoglycerate dehydrogenase n=1 Tax=Amycolatopsis sp. 195334CR TaxID=2814588 RepID=UPI001A8C82EA|nr:phosphoglycerate dehydrogenase [Amycolatopsis sp. 195334CR]MBN6041107.1 phosphoglycerate dehydrogenase [Amycolatopsis sp. 195334CR]